MDDLLLKKANAYVLRLFKLRPRSCFELTSKLLAKGYSEDIAKYLVNKYIANGFLNDDVFAKAWMNARLKKYGFYRVERELRQKGVDINCIENAKTLLLKEYDEVLIIEGMIEKRLKIYKRSNPSLQRLILKRRMMDYFVRRGFRIEHVMKVVNKL